MLGINDLKYYVITDMTPKYDEINRKIIKFTKLYFNTMKNHSFQISQIENKLNEYNIKGEVKIKQLLENQQNIIKELIKIVNNCLKEIRNNEILKKNEEYFPLKQKNIIMNNNLHIFTVPHYPNSITKANYSKNKTKEKRTNTSENYKNTTTNDTLRTSNINKSVEDKTNHKNILNQKKIISLNVIAPKSGNEYNGTLSYLNIKPSKQNKKNLFGKFVNKEKTKKNTNNNNVKHKIFKSMSSSEINYKPKINNKNNLYLQTNNISNNNPIYINNNYTIDEEKNDIEGISLINERQNSISSSNINENYGNLPHILTKRKKRIKYRIGGGKILLTEKDLNGKGLARVKSAKEIPIKNDFFLNYNSSFPNFTITNSSVDKNSDFSFNRRSNSSLCIFNGNLNNIIRENNKAIKKLDNEIYSIPYINNGKRIIPTRYTKEVLNKSYKILNKYEQKRFKNH
jgi:hypothetical protein